MPWLVRASSFDAYISAARRPSLGSEMKAVDACIAIVNFDKDPNQAAETAQYLTQVLGRKLTIIAIAKDNDPAMLLMAMRAGCSEFLYEPLQESAVAQMLDRLAQLWSNSVMQSAVGGSIVSFFGVKGGVGTTTLAMHLAMYLVQCHQKRTLLIDNHPELGHVCVYLGLDGSRYHFHELVRNVSRLDSELLHGFVANHPSGLDVLSSPDAYGETKNMDPESVAKTLEFLRSEYDYVIIDCGMSFGETNLAVIHASARVHLIATQEFAAIRDLSRCVDKFSQVDSMTDKLQVVVNRFTSSYAIHMDQIEKAIKLPVSFCISDCYTELVRSANLGETISPKSKLAFASQLVKWTEAMVGSSQRIAVIKKDKKIFPIWKRALLHPDS
jgi:pilus assembly protein CpaE